VGGGGKTTAMFALARALKKLGKRVLVTTTTNIFFPAKDECDEVIVNSASDMGLFRSVRASTVTVFGKEIVNDKNKKLAGVDKEFLELLYQQGIFDYILVECDGARRKPIKAPARYEPIVPDRTTKAIGVIGLDAVGSPITDDYVHRLELFCTVVKRQPGEILDEEAVVNLIVSSQGLFKGVPDGCGKYLLLNKAENARRRLYAGNILIGLLKRDTVPITMCIVAALARNKIYP
jgi:probable selenium-dependent hydroxylase accessory protein YqeC